MKTPRPTIAPNANQDRPPVCQFCDQPAQVVSFTPDRYGGHFHTKPCGCPGEAEARQASAEFRRKLGMR